MRRAAVGVAALLLLGAAGEPGPKGHLFIVGGGEAPPELAARFVELAGGTGHARIAVIPMASSEPEATGAEKVEELTGLGADAFVLNLSREQALDPAQAAQLEDVGGIWFCGGDQARLTPILLGTPMLAAVRRRYREGAVVGGTSAGAAIMSDSMLTGNQRQPDSLGYYGDEYPAVARDYIEVVPGLGFLSGVIIDQHFLRRERQNRLLSVVLERPTLLGAGIDEGTVLEVDPDGRWRVFGRSAVLIFDARRARVTGEGAGVLGTTGVRLSLLPAGSSYDPRSGEATLPPATR